MPSEIPSLDWWVTAGKATRAHWEHPKGLRGWTQQRAQMFPELLSSQMESELHRGAGEMQLLSPEGDVLRQSRDLKENLIRSDPKGFNCSPTHHSCRARSDCPAQDLLHKTNPFSSQKTLQASISSATTSQQQLSPLLSCHGDMKLLQGPISSLGSSSSFPALLTELSALKLTSCSFRLSWQGGEPQDSPFHIQHVTESACAAAVYLLLCLRSSLHLFSVFGVFKLPLKSIILFNSS